MAYDWSTSSPGVFALHEDTCPVRNGGRCTCEHRLYRAVIDRPGSDQGEFGPAFWTIAEARAWKRGQQDSLGESVLSPVSLSTIIAAFLDAAARGEVREPSGQPYTDQRLRELRGALSYADSEFGWIAVQEISRRQVQGLIDELHMAGLGATHLGVVAAALHSLYSYAIQRGAVEHTPIVDLTFPPRGDETFVPPPSSGRLAADGQAYDFGQNGSTGTSQWIPSTAEYRAAVEGPSGGYQTSPDGPSALIGNPDAVYPPTNDYPTPGGQVAAGGGPTVFAASSDAIHPPTNGYPPIGGQPPPNGNPSEVTGISDVGYPPTNSYPPPGDQPPPKDGPNTSTPDPDAVYPPASGHAAPDGRSAPGDDPNIPTGTADAVQPPTSGYPAPGLPPLNNEANAPTGNPDAVYPPTSGYPTAGGQRPGPPVPQGYPTTGFQPAPGYYAQPGYATPPPGYPTPDRQQFPSGYVTPSGYPTGGYATPPGYPPPPAYATGQAPQAPPQQWNSTGAFSSLPMGTPADQAEYDANMQERFLWWTVRIVVIVFVLIALVLVAESV
jgi:hypothetical protein